MKKYLGFVVSAFLGAVVAIFIFQAISDKDAKVNFPAQAGESKLPVHLTSQPVAYSPQVLLDFTEAAGKTINTVVHIKTEYSRQSGTNNYFFDWRDFFGYPDDGSGQEPSYAAGSGVIISQDGYIVTNNHVVENADAIQVVLNDKKTYKAQLIGKDPSTDLALIKIDAVGLPFITYGNSDDLKVGEWVLAVGNPFNLTSTVTAGIVSAKARNINILQSPDGTSAIESYIQTDAAVNRGNSGGALVNIKGELVGINSAIASGTGYYAGYSFAIPSSIVKKVVSDLLEYGEVQRALMGVQIRDIDSDLANQVGITKLNGVYVNGVTNNGSAKEAGIESGDIITSIDNTPVNSSSELLAIVGTKHPGDEVLVTVNRNNNEKNFRLVLRNIQGNTGIIKKEDVNIISMLGATFEPVTTNDKKKLSLEYGLKIIDIKKGKLSDAGIGDGFIITRIDRRPMRTVDDLREVLSNVSDGILIEGIYPNGMRAYYGVGL
ncbi:MAG: trypsin-like peptidase domain-containing protein [Bacteroidetes bacterium]|nr:trypsin-like peptidase domain-containing protein [Bacteroidota bacterium]